MDPDTSLPFFFYGTLRPGEGNYPRLPETEEWYPAFMTRAKIHYVSHHSGYPVLDGRQQRPGAQLQSAQSPGER